MSISGTELRHGERGITLIEVLVVVAVLGIGVVSVALYLEPFEAPVESGANELAAFLRQSRARAMATTSSYRVYPQGKTRVLTSYAPTCGPGPRTVDPDLSLELPEDVELASSSWFVCFNARGVSSQNLTITLDGHEYGSEQVEVLLGGAASVVK